MGKKHALTLADLGDTIELTDLDFKAGPKVKDYDSLLLCTPPETHASLIRQLAEYSIPLFVEKPVINSLNESAIAYPGKSMVACNWRWCNDITTRGRNSIECEYQNAKPHDIIHFVDRFWEEHRGVKTAWRGQEYLILEDRKHMLKVRISESRETKSLFNSVSIEHQCDMFVKQMQSWRSTIRGEQEINPISKAAQRTTWLLKLLS